MERPTLKELVTRVKSDFNYRLSGESITLRYTLATVFSYVIAGVAHLLYSFISYLADMLMPDKAKGIWLERHGSIWGIKKKSEDYATGTAIFTGSENAGVGVDKVLNAGTGLQYRTTSSGFIKNGVLELPIICEDPGERGNLEDSDFLELNSPIPGVKDEVSIASPGITNGLNRETEEFYQQRVVERIRNPIAGGNDGDYERWAKEVSGITRAWTFPEYLGGWTVGVTFVQDGQEDIVPNAAKVLEVQEYLNERRCVGAEIFCFAPEAKPVDVELVVDPDSPEVRAAVESELRDLVIREAQPGKTIPLTHIREAISVATGEYDHTLISPTEDVTFQQNEIPVPGSVVWPS
ncbi:baseplate J/gp47 family protein [Halobacteriovorax sp. GB3]|uniref:baseplate J/gp47 family protein n=1 Tax=Halobacteriovorax sp. GB3 TaxID=2719615 RepID=UPI00235FAF7C|nr:baseplate J/gp47 family protein [Halobacteriovorax sp. GB3]MDD0853002.1 baseplate J/gp47 family protein [Halobacteriovorax sp. GB3]